MGLTCTRWQWINVSNKVYVLSVETVKQKLKQRAKRKLSVSDSLSTLNLTQLLNGEPKTKKLFNNWKFITISIRLVNDSSSLYQYIIIAMFHSMRSIIQVQIVDFCTHFRIAFQDIFINFDEFPQFSCNYITVIIFRYWSRYFSMSVMVSVLFFGLVSFAIDWMSQRGNLQI